MLKSKFDINLMKEDAIQLCILFVSQSDLGEQHQQFLSYELAIFKNGISHEKLCHMDSSNRNQASSMPAGLMIYKTLFYNNL